MKRIIIVLIYFLIPLISIGQSLGNNENFGFYSLNNTFTSFQLTESKLSGFEERAIQKIKDLSNYVELISSPDYDNGIRQYAMNEAVKLFIDSEIKINDFNFETHKNEIFSINNYLENIINSNYSQIVSQINNIRIIKNLEKTGTGVYKGKISYTQEYTCYINDEIISKYTFIKHVDIVLVRVEKNFGNETKKVWQIFLANIYFVE